MAENLGTIAEFLGTQVADTLRRMERKVDDLEARVRLLERQSRDGMTFRVQASAAGKPENGSVVLYARGVAGSEKLYQRRPDGTESALS